MRRQDRRNPRLGFLSDLFGPQRKVLQSGQGQAADRRGHLRGVLQSSDLAQQQAARLNATFARDLASEAYKNLTAITATMKKYSPTAKLVEAFAAYDKHKNDQPRTGLYSAQLCAMFVNLRQMPFDFVEEANSRCRLRKARLRVNYGDVLTMEKDLDPALDALKSELHGKPDAEIEAAKTALRKKAFGIVGYSRYEKKVQESEDLRKLCEAEEQSEKLDRQLSIVASPSRGLPKLPGVVPVDIDPFSGDCSMLLDSSFELGSTAGIDVSSCCTVQATTHGLRPMNMSLRFP